MLAGTLLVLSAAALAAVFDSIPVLASVRVLQGFGFSAYFVAMFSYVLDLVPPSQRGWALGIYGVSGVLATAFAPPAGGIIVRRAGFPPLFAASPGFGLLPPVPF